jgi:tripeptide aminopeptidase
MKTVTERFINYARIDTQSDETSQTTPSTLKQFDLARLLIKELEDLELQDIEMDEHGYIMATLAANAGNKVPVIGFIAHMDTSPDMSGADVKPKIIKNYDGNEIVLNEQDKVILSPKDFPDLMDYIGQDLITTDGTTLLGADDKAGIAEIMAAMEYLKNHPEIKHGKIRIAFTVDEEIGRGADKFDVKKFGADYAYTLDGGRIGELEYENFNAALATVHVQGRNVHPGTAKDAMINAIHLAMEFNGTLPVQQRPEYTQGYEGFFHLIDFNGEVEQTTFRYIIRDHDRTKFELKKKLIMDCADFMNKKYGNGRIRVELKDQYFNMREKVEPVKIIVDIAEEAMTLVGVQPIIKPIRGGTDGSKLSYMGLPCPNIFAGGHNFHGKYEFVPIHSMEKAVEVIVKIAGLYPQKDW